MYEHIKKLCLYQQLTNHETKTRLPMGLAELTAYYESGPVVHNSFKKISSYKTKLLTNFEKDEVIC